MNNNFPNLLKWHKKTLKHVERGLQARVASSCKVSSPLVSDFVNEKKCPPAIVNHLSGLSRNKFVDLMGYRSAPALTNRTSNAERLLNDMLDASNQDSYAAAAEALGYEIRDEFKEYVSDLKRKKELQRAFYIQDFASERLPLNRLHQAEVDALRQVGLALRNPNHKPVLVSATVHGGARYLLHHLMQIDVVKGSLTGPVCHVYCDKLIRNTGQDPASSLQESLAQLQKTLDPEAKALYSPASLVRTLRQCRGLVILHNVSALLDRASDFALKSLVEELAVQDSKNRPLGGSSVLVVVQWRTAALSNLTPFEYIGFEPKIGPEEAKLFFNQMREVYEALRGDLEKNLAANDWPRWKRNDRHYELMEVQDNPRRRVSPASVRFRAVCLSHGSNHSCYDATQGLKRLVGAEMLSKVPEVEMIAQDVTVHLAAMEKSKIQALRLVSTGVYFLSREMRDRLQKHGLEGDFRDGGFLSGRNGKGDGFNASMLVRSIVQDDWINRDGPEKYKIHKTVAEILEGFARGKGAPDVETEYPFPAPWGNAQILWLSESIRQYVRAADGDPDQAKSMLSHASDLMDNIDGDWLDRSRPKAAAPEIASSPAARAKELSVSTGQYRLKLELIGLLSDPNSPGQPHPDLELSTQEKSAFHQELGSVYAQLLNLEEAKAALLAAIDEAKVANTAFQEIKCRLELSAVYLDQANEAEAATQITICRSLLKQVDEAEEIERAERKLSIQAASLALAKGDRASGLLHLKHLFPEDKIDPLTDEAALKYIDTLLFRISGVQSRSTEEYNSSLRLAWKLCERLRASSLDARQGHQSLRIEIRRARVLRVLGFPEIAEAILDWVASQMDSHGSSEREFKEFQLESVMTLAAVGRPRYAIAAYAMPAARQLERTAAESFKKRLANLQRRVRGHYFDLHKGEDPKAFVDHPFWRKVERRKENPDPYNSQPLLPSRERVQANLVELDWPNDKSEDHQREN